jgi:hypothetical protein
VEGGINMQGGTNATRWFLCDLNRKKVLGELLQAEPMFVKGDDLICVQHPKQYSDRMLALAWISNGRIPIPLKQDKFLKVNMKNGRSTKVGECPTLLQSPVLLRASPNGRFAYYNNPLGSFGRPYFFDTEEKKVWLGMIENRASAPEAWGWWSATEVILHDQWDNYLLYDVPNRRTATFISVAELKNVYSGLGLPIAAGAERVLTVRNGAENDVYLLSEYDPWRRVGTLLKVERPSRALTLVSTNFHYFFNGEWNPARTHYLYCSDEQLNGHIVHLRNLRDGTDQTLIGRGESYDYYSHPKFYGERVVYIHDNGLWMADLNGSNQFRIFPPIQ